MFELNKLDELSDEELIQNVVEFADPDEDEDEFDPFPEDLGEDYD